MAIDTGFGQMAHKLRVDPRVRLMERTNARTLKPGEVVDREWVSRFDFSRWM